MCRKTPVVLSLNSKNNYKSFFVVTNVTKKKEQEKLKNLIKSENWNNKDSKRNKPRIRKKKNGKDTTIECKNSVKKKNYVRNSL